MVVVVTASVESISTQIRILRNCYKRSVVALGPSDLHPNWHLGMCGTQHRAVMWRVWKEGGTGFLYWGANCYEKATVASAEIRFRRGLPPGDGVLFYPSEVFSTNQLVASVRLERILSGLPPGDGVLFYPNEVFSTNQLVASVRLERILSGMQDIEHLNLYTTGYGRHGGLALLKKTGVYLGPEHYTHEHMPVDIMRGEIFSACRS